MLPVVVVCTNAVPLNVADITNVVELGIPVI